MKTLGPNPTPVWPSLVGLVLILAIFEFAIGWAMTHPNDHGRRERGDVCMCIGDRCAYPR